MNDRPVSGGEIHTADGHFAGAFLLLIEFRMMAINSIRRGIRDAENKHESAGTLNGDV